MRDRQACAVRIPLTSSGTQVAGALQRLDPAAMTFTTFAANGSYTGPAATNGGVWNAVLGRALILDTFANTLRSFGSGEVGDGTTFATDVSGAGTAEDARMLQIAGGAPTVPALPVWGVAALASALAAGTRGGWRRR